MFKHTFQVTQMHLTSLRFTQTLLKHTEAPSSLHTLTLGHLGTLLITIGHLGSLRHFLGTTLGPSRHILAHLDSPRHTWSTQVHLGPLKFIQAHLDPLRFTEAHLNPLRSPFRHSFLDLYELHGCMAHFIIIIIIIIYFYYYQSLVYFYCYMFFYLYFLKLFNLFTIVIIF